LFSEAVGNLIWLDSCRPHTKKQVLRRGYRENGSTELGPFRDMPWVKGVAIIDLLALLFHSGKLKNGSRVG